ncbi:MAG TPA: ABC transporter substrate-binding protein, partial [Anaerolineales bacterium]
EVLHSDVGQLAWMKGYAHGVQQADLESRGAIPADLVAKLPASSAFAGAVAPSPDQLTKAKDLITNGWMSTVGAVQTEVP